MENRKTTRLCIVRHGETDWNAQKRIQGHIDVPLNAVGLSQAAAAAAGLAGLRFRAVYSSDLSRAWQTAKAAAGVLGAELLPAVGLRERNYGVFQGRTAAEMAREHPDIHARYQARDPHYNFVTGESLESFAARVVGEVEALASRHVGESLLLISHGGALDICYRRATDRPLSTPRDFTIPNAAFNWFEVGPAGWRLLAWGDRKHLEQALEEVVE